MPVKTIEVYFERRPQDPYILDVTRQVEHSIIDSKFKDGVVNVFAPSEKTSISTMEYEEGSIADMYQAVERIAPTNGHAMQKGGLDRLSNARAALVGPSVTIPFKEGRLSVGKWQEIVLFNFDTKETRKKVIIQIVGEGNNFTFA